MPISLLNTNGTGGTSMLNRFGNGGVSLLTPTAPPLPPAPLLLDTYSGASMALSLRKLRTNYTGSAIRVKRTSDNAQQDIGFVGTGLDTASLISFVGAGTGTVVNWYDQSGNGYDVGIFSTAGTADIIVSGVLKTLYGNPALYFNGTKAYVGPYSPNIYSATKQSITFGVGNALDTDIRLMLAFSGGEFNAQVIRTNGGTLETIAYQSSGIAIDTGNVDVGNSQFIACVERGDTTAEMWINNSSNGGISFESPAAGNYPVPVVGGFNETSYQWFGHMQEIIVFALNPSSNTTYRNDVSTALNSYYTTY
jgi:hypothetical protein